MIVYLPTNGKPLSSIPSIAKREKKNLEFARRHDQVL
jgi:hypothetical protein